MNPPSTSNRETRDTPDAVGRGVLGHDPAADATLFVVAGPSLGATVIEGEGTPRWYDLRRVVGLDAVGDETDGRVPVELRFDDGATLVALWPAPFCDKVVVRLKELLEQGMMLPPSGADGPDEHAVSPVAPVPPVAAAPPAAGQAPREQGGTQEDRMWASSDDRPMPGDGPALVSSPGDPGAGELTLEDVVYHGGYPGQTKRRKRCVAVLDSTGVAVSGPNGPEFQIDWSTVNSVETQNADEAKFRLNIKAKRNSSALVLECQQGVTVVLEAHDVPTMPLRAALHQILDGRQVNVA